MRASAIYFKSDKVLIPISTKAEATCENPFTTDIGDLRLLFNTYEPDSA